MTSFTLSSCDWYDPCKFKPLPTNGPGRKEFFQLIALRLNLVAFSREAYLDQSCSPDKKRVIVSAIEVFWDFYYAFKRLVTNAFGD